MVSDLLTNPGRRPVLWLIATVVFLASLRLLSKNTSPVPLDASSAPGLQPVTVPGHSGMGYRLVFPSEEVTFPDGASVSVHRSSAEYGEFTHNFWTRLQEGNWEDTTFTAFRGCLAPAAAKTTVLDFGSWIGPTVLYAAALGAGQVLSFEPDPAAFAELSVNVGLNGFAAVKLHQACIGAKEGPLTLYFRGGDSVSSTAAFESEEFKLRGKFPVYCHTVQSVLERYHRQDAPLFIKIDTEGFEVDLLPSLHAVFKKYKPAVHLSAHPQLRKFGDAEWRAVCEAVALFPRAHVPEDPEGGWGGKSGWRRAKVASVKECSKALKAQKQPEILLTWNDKQCTGMG